MPSDKQMQRARDDDSDAFMPLYPSCVMAAAVQNAILYHSASLAEWPADKASTSEDAPAAGVNTAECKQPKRLRDGHLKPAHQL